MTRHEQRELAFHLLFEKNFSQDEVEDILLNAREARDVEEDAFALSLAQGTVSHLAEIDQQISAFSHKWSKNRLSRVALTLLRMAVYEMSYEPATPVGVAINEAVELAKTYGGQEDAAFINGVLGGIARGMPV